MSRHEGVSCDNCLKSNFEGKRFKCLICYDYDLCESCQVFDVATSRHIPSHPMQCILTRNEFDLYYGGESLSPDSPPAFVCPHCSKLGFTESLLQEHVTKEHADVRTEVVCPVCAAMPSGDPNLVTEDLSHHLSMEHRASREGEDSVVGRHIRRRGMRTRNHRNMNFFGGPGSSTAAPSSAVSASNNNASSLRDSMDPIAELLSQLSGVRRSAQQLQQNVTTASQLQELQTQLQLERQRAADIRQQLERFPNKLQSTSNGTQSINVHSSAVGVATSKAATKKSSTLINTEEEDSSRYLLSCLDEVDLTEAEKEEQAKEDNHRSLFVQELLFSMLSSDNTDEKLPSDSDNTMLLSMERATPVDCALLSTTPTYASQTQESSKNVSFSKTTYGDRDGSTKSDAEEKKVPENSSCSNSVSDENRDTVLVNSMLAGNSTSAVSLQVDRNPGERLEEAPVASSRSAPSLSPENRLLSEAQQWKCRDADVDSDKESDEDKPPSPTPVQPQHLALRLPGRVFASGSGPVRLSAPDYGREDVASASLNKNIR
ncbi:unnamed protein product [Clavelina lepadiformis]|uniref:RING-type E3 ubiquitin transferase n=1 Tax=Clavelina lepadiformis TaxID=159417 RepID=A0ABP0FNY3_CLALP